MSAEIVMPRLSDSMEEGTVLAWLKQVGEEVAIGEELVEIETDKANMVYESDVAGVLTEVLAGEGETLAVGAAIARIGKPGEAVPNPAATPAGVSGESVPSQTPTRGAPAELGATAGVAAGRVEDGGRRASPLARRVAAGLGVDLATVDGSGPGGRIVKADVRRAAAAGPKAPAPSAPVAAAAPGGGEARSAKGEAERVELSKLQQTVARRMSESKATAPHFYLEVEVDMGSAVAARAGLKRLARDGEPVPSFNDLVVKACAIALREHPPANGAYRDGRFEHYSRVNVGIAVAAEGALVVPTIFDADRKSLREIAGESRELAARVRAGEITPPELSGGTFTVSNLGMFGIASFGAIVNTPQAGILAVGAVVERPVARGGELAVGKTMAMTLSCDHRILYGAPAAQFLSRIRELLEVPASLAL